MEGGDVDVHDHNYKHNTCSKGSVGSGDFTLMNIRACTCTINKGVIATTLSNDINQLLLPGYTRKQPLHQEY